MQDMSNSREKLSPKFLQALKEFEVLPKSELTPMPSINKGEKITGQGMHPTLRFLLFNLKRVVYIRGYINVLGPTQHYFRPSR